MSWTTAYDLTGKVALITGAARGIGLAIARQLSELGCSVAIHDIELDLARQEASRLPNAIGLGGDISDLAAVEMLIPDTFSQLEGLHILVNNAGIQFSQPFEDHPPDEIDRVLRGNLHATIRLCQQAVPIFKSQSWGRILSIGSIQGRTGVATMLPYSMSKAALNNLTTGLARELGEWGVTVNCIAPGWFNTLRNKDHFNNAHPIKKGAIGLPLRRHGNPVDVAPVAGLLCSEAGAYITGQTLYVDGGMSAQ